MKRDSYKHIHTHLREKLQCDSDKTTERGFGACIKSGGYIKQLGTHVFPRCNANFCALLVEVERKMRERKKNTSIITTTVGSMRERH